MVRLVTLAMTTLVATSLACQQATFRPREKQRIMKTPQQLQDPDLEEDRTINLVTDVVVRAVECNK